MLPVSTFLPRRSVRWGTQAPDQPVHGIARRSLGQAGQELFGSSQESALAARRTCDGTRYELDRKDRGARRER